MIKSFKVTGLWGHKNYDLSESLIQQDSNKLTIITGSNGTGKTTLLKLMWYMISVGTHPNLVEIEHLSAGEKNFLSFLVYAISSPNGIIIY